MCKCDFKDYTKEEYGIIIGNDYVYCQGYYDDVDEILKEYWQTHKQCCDRNGFEKECVHKKCLKYLK